MDYKKPKCKVGDVVLVKNALNPYQNVEKMEETIDYVIGTIKGISWMEHRGWEYNIEAGFNPEILPLSIKETQIIEKL